MEQMSWVLRKYHTQLNRKRYKVLPARIGRIDQKCGAGIHVIIFTECETFFARRVTVKKVHENGPGGADPMVQQPTPARDSSDRR